MPEKTPLDLLEDRRVLRLAYAASSAPVMRRGFELTRELQVFRGRKDLAPAILERLRGYAKTPGESEIVGAHLYALELTGAGAELAQGVKVVLADKRFQVNPLVGQMAGHIGARLARKDLKLQPDSWLTPDQLDEIRKALPGEGGRR